MLYWPVLLLVSLFWVWGRYRVGWWNILWFLLPWRSRGGWGWQFLLLRVLWGSCWSIEFSLSSGLIFRLLILLYFLISHVIVRYFIKTIFILIPLHITPWHWWLLIFDFASSYQISSMLLIVLFNLLFLNFLQEVVIESVHWL